MLKKFFPELDFSQFWDDDELALEEYVDDAPSDTLIASVENELGYKLPDSYIAMMKHHNGGVPYATCYVLPEGADDEADYIEITHADPYVPSMPLIDVKKAELSEFVDKRIFVFERSSQFELLSKVHTTFMWMSPTPEDVKEKYGLVVKQCKGNKKIYRDVLIYRSGYKLTELDNAFIGKVVEARKKHIESFEKS